MGADYELRLPNLGRRHPHIHTQVYVGGEPKLSLTIWMGNMDVGSFGLFAREEEQSELPVAGDRRCHAKTGKRRLRTVSGATFLWLLLQHVLPKGFRRARNYGFLHPNSQRLIALMRLRVFRPPPCLAQPIKRATLVRRCCGEPMIILKRRMPPSMNEPPSVAAQATI